MENAVEHVMDVLHVSEDIRGGDDRGGPVLVANLGGDLRPEESGPGGNPLCAGNGPHLTRLDASDAVPTVLEVAQQRAVIGADVNHQIVGPQLEEPAHL